MDGIEVVSRITFIFFIYLVLAIFVERTIEVLISVFNYIELKKEFHHFWNARARAYQKRFERIYSYQGKTQNKMESLLNWLNWKIVSDKPYTGGKVTISADLIRINYIRVGTRILALIISFILVLVIDLDIIRMIKKLLPGPEFAKDILEYDAVKVIITAAAISIGSEPLHELITKIENVGKKKATQKQGGTK
jgi:hypothetical protein